MIGKVRMRLKGSQKESGKTGSNDAVAEEVASQPSSNEETQPLARNISDPCELDILLGRGKTSWGHTGNQHFRAFIGVYLKQYSDAGNRAQKSKTVETIYTEIIASGGRFLKYDNATKTWYQVGRTIAREKIAHALRDAIGLRIKVLPADHYEEEDEDDEEEADQRETKQRRSRKRGTESFGITRRSEERLPTDDSDHVLPTSAPSNADALRSDEFPVPAKPAAKDQAHPTSSFSRQVSVAETMNSAVSFDAQSRASLPSISRSLIDSVGDESMQSKNFLSLVNSMLADEEAQRVREQARHHHSAVDDELSTGLSAMSIDSLRSGKSGKSGKSGAKSAIFELSDEFRSLKRSAQEIPSNGNNNSEYDAMIPELSGGPMRQTERIVPSSSAPPFHLGPMDALANHAECESASLDWTKTGSGDAMSEIDIGSLDDLSFQSKEHSIKSSKYQPRPIGGDNSQSEDTSRSSETEREWNKTLMALRGI
jgi:hypothetical protein